MSDLQVSHRVFAVVHVESLTQAVNNCAIAHEAGCDGAFLISHRQVGWLALAELVAPCRSRIPWVGINFLDLSANTAVMVAREVKASAVWTDDTYLGEKPDDVEVFSGFAFKHQPQPSAGSLVAEAQEAARRCHVLTTSGPATGVPASVEHVEKLRVAIGDGRLALASGVSADNVREFMPCVSDFLVASSISASWQELDPKKTRDLVNVVRGRG